MKKNTSKKIITYTILLLTVCFISCTIVNAAAIKKNIKNNENLNFMCVAKTPLPINVDGKLDEIVWKNAQTYKLHRAVNREKDGAKVSQSGEVKLAWDTNYFYIGVKFNDLDIIAEGKKNQQKHFQLGDLCELFLSPKNNTWYWEMYVTPAGKKSCFFIPGRGRLGLPSMMEYKSELKVAAKVNGTLNDWRDKDISWTAEMAVPIKELTARGEKFGNDGGWTILVARYNYGRYIDSQSAELNMTPQLSRENYHLLSEFAPLKFVK